MLLAWLASFESPFDWLEDLAESSTIRLVFRHALKQPT